MKYGTYLVEGVMNSAPKQIKVYVLVGAVAEDTPTFAN